MLKGEQELEKVPYGEQLYRILFQIVGNKKNASLIESLRGENAVLTWLVRQEEDVHPGDLAEKLSLVPGRMTDILKTLEKKGMIRRERDPEDRRRVLVRITPKGARSVTERREQIRDLQKYLPCEAVIYGRLPLMITENGLADSEALSEALKLASERKETAICAVLMESGRGSAGKGQELSLEDDDWDDW